MSDKTHWISAIDEVDYDPPTPALVDDEYTDQYGQKVDVGNIGIALGQSAVLEGTLDEIRRYVAHLAQLVDWPGPLVPGRWWKVTTADGTLSLETSNEAEARHDFGELGGCDAGATLWRCRRFDTEVGFYDWVETD